MALIQCPECSGQISSKAYLCPHCGFLLAPAAMQAFTRTPRKVRKRRPNGSGTIVKLSGKRKNPFQVRVNTRIDADGYPVYDILDNFPDRVSAEIALAEYNKVPYNPNDRKKLFCEVFDSWYTWKYKVPHTAAGPKTSSQNCAIAAYKKCSTLYNIAIWDIRTQDMQDILDRSDLSHATLEHVRNLFRQMYKYAIQYEMVPKDYSLYTSIRKADDDIHGVPFTPEEIWLLWTHKNIPFVDTILIYCYSGFRINELALMPLDDIDLDARTFTGGLKNRYSRNRTVPIHSAVYPMVCRRYSRQFDSLIYHTDTDGITEIKYREYFNAALRACGIQTEHTPHDCRHTFNVLLDRAGVDRAIRYKLMGHKGTDINETVYTHKDIEQLREAIESIKTGA